MASDGLVAIFDSGVGGLSVWEEIVRQIPHADTLYLADQAHVPYGSRSLLEVQRLSRAISRFLIDRGASVVVVACNTASAAALHDLRRTFPEVPFVGMEPAVKPAVERTRSGKVGVIATEATFQGKLFSSLLERYAGDVQVLAHVCPGLVDAVEAGAWDTPETEALIRRCLAPLLEAGIDQLVLGCTHYPFLRPTIERIVDGTASIIDPAPAVARRTAHVLAGMGKSAGPRYASSHQFYTTGDPDVFSKRVKQLVPGSWQPAETAKVDWVGGRLMIGPRGLL